MRWHSLRIPLGLGLLLAICFLPPSPSLHGASRKPKSPIPVQRWDEQTPGCTFSHSDDGKLHYGLWSGDVGIMLAVDSQELEKVRRRHEPFFSVFVTLRDRGPAAFDVNPENISLEFVKHFHVTQSTLDPDAFAQKIQDDADDLDHETARFVQRHPEKKEQKDAYVRAFQKDTAELLEFVSKDTLRPSRLGPASPETTGWLLFSADSKWIGRWKKREQLILLLPVDGKIFEFPFTLPPPLGENTLRRRE